jgi:DNA-directed RNA polymerase specialized sigma24 family protein
MQDVQSVRRPCYLRGREPTAIVTGRNLSGPDTSSWWSGMPGETPILEMPAWQAPVWRSRLARLVEVYSAELCQQPWTPAHACFARALERLENCLSRHAQTAPPEIRAEPQLLIEALRSGRGFVRRGDLGGDVLRDLVLAEAVEHGDGRAWSTFVREYSAIIQAAERKLGARLRIHEGAQILEKLPAKLAKYRGDSALSGFLPLVAANLLTDFARMDAKGPIVASLELAAWDGAEDAGDPAQTTECRMLLESFMRRARERLDPRHRLAVALHADGASGQDIARILKVHKGTVSRLLPRAVDTMRAFLEDERRRDPVATADLEECLAYLSSGDKQSAVRALFSCLLSEHGEAQS